VKQVLIRKGKAYTEDVPTPTVSENTILVQVHCSCISVGTELSGVISSGQSLIKKALKQPEKIAKVIDNVKKEGLFRTVQKIQGELEQGTQTGYSASGLVVEVGVNIKDIENGDRVACAGAGIANHAEYIEVPRNLLVKIPDEVDFDLASTVTLGAIAMQGVRRANVKLGEYVTVIGLGILGQITVQLLKANGCRVIGVDLDERRIQKAIVLGMDKGINSKNEDVVKIATAFSNGFGVDAVIITAATNSNEPLVQAFQMCRKKGRVVLVGVVGMEINREDMYKKELDFLISTSYGPGRYDENYEQKGIDYPYAYVRWTETRNMQEYLKLIAEKKIDIKPLIEKEYKIGEAPIAYEELKTSENKPLIVLLKYNQEQEKDIIRKIDVQSKPIKKDGRINIAVIGAGNFAKGMHLPSLQRLNKLYNIHAIASKTGSNAKAIAKQYGASYTTTDFRDILLDKDIDMVIIATRHNLHAAVAIEAAKASKAVFVEKPMALNRKELNELVQVLEETKIPFMVGFNRRFSPLVRRIKEIIKDRINPMIINYRMNASYIPMEHWIHTEEGGGRNIGEACHIYDLFTFFTESEVKSISASSIDPKTKQYAKNDNFNTTIKYIDGSVCNLIYTALGSKDYPKEEMDIYVDSKVIRLDNYQSLKVFGTKNYELKTKHKDKGHLAELQGFAKNIKEGNGYPIPLWQLIQATEISFEVEKLLCAK